VWRVVCTPADNLNYLNVKTRAGGPGVWRVVYIPADNLDYLHAKTGQAALVCGG
jgi:hypothetical protein